MSNFLRATSLVPYLLLLGLALPTLAPCLARAADRTPEQSWRLLALVFAAGLLLNNLLVVAAGHLWLAMATGLAIGICCAAIALRYGGAPGRALRFGGPAALCFAVVLAVLAAAALLEPLYAWDARSIWFFQGKILYFAGGLLKDAGWTSPYHLFWHPDYPKLVPILAAQAATLAGLWNEQLPKFSLPLLLVPALAATLSYWRSGLAALALLVIVWAKVVPELCNGDMDSPLAIYGLLGTMLIASGLTAEAELDFAVGAVFIAITVCLKNEGSLLAVAVIAWAATAAALARKRPPAGRRLDRTTIGAVLAFALITAGSWLVLRKIWGFENELQLGLGSLPIIAARLRDPVVLWLVLQNTVLAHGLVYAAMIGACATLFSWGLRTKVIESIFCLAAAALYLVGLFVVYLAIPYSIDLKWQLESADRTTLVAVLLLLAPVILLLRDEHRWRVPAFFLRSRRTVPGAAQ